MRVVRHHVELAARSGGAERRDEAGTHERVGVLADQRRAFRVGGRDRGVRGKPVRRRHRADRLNLAQVLGLALGMLAGVVDQADVGAPLRYPLDRLLRRQGRDLDLRPGRGAAQARSLPAAAIP